ncbi:MAG: hypothetical protein KQH67_05205 [Bacteroidetes bacterium]|nr:hypothetical protein [Bacteroidota bacterium]
MELTENKIREIRREFEKRRKRRVGLFVFALVFLLIVGFIALPLMDYYGVPRLVWAPFVYLVMFGILITIGFVWRCPVCNGLLGDVFTTKYCSKCGFKFSDKTGANEF